MPFGVPDGFAKISPSALERMAGTTGLEPAASAVTESTKGIQGNSLTGLLDPDRTRIFQSCGPVPKRRGLAAKMEMTLESVASGYFQMATARGFTSTILTPQICMATAAKTGGLKNYFVELNWDPTVQSVAYLKILNV